MIGFSLARIRYEAIRAHDSQHRYEVALTRTSGIDDDAIYQKYGDNRVLENA